MDIKYLFKKYYQAPQPCMKRHSKNISRLRNHGYKVPIQKILPGSATMHEKTLKKYFQATQPWLWRHSNNISKLRNHGYKVLKKYYQAPQPWMLRHSKNITRLRSHGCKDTQKIFPDTANMDVKILTLQKQYKWDARQYFSTFK